MQLSDQHVLILGSFFTTNLGDRAILAAERRLVAELGGKQVTPFPFKPGRYTGDTTDWRVDKAVRQLYYVPVHYLKLFVQARSARAVVIGGGNLLEDHSNMTSILTLITCLVIRAAGARLSFLAIGTAPFKSRLSRLLYGFSLNLAERVSVRDPISHNRLAALVPKHKLELVCDPALTLPPDPQTSGKKGWKVGIVVGPHWHSRYDYAPDAQEFRAYLQYIGRLADRLVERYGTGSVLFFASDPPADQAAIDDLRSSGFMRAADQVTLCTPSTLEELLAVVRDVNVIVSTRLHPILLGISQGTPGVAVNVGSKMQGFYSSVDLSEYCIGLDADPERFIAATDELIQCPERFMARFAAASQGYVQGLKANISNICMTAVDSAIPVQA